MPTTPVHAAPVHAAHVPPRPIAGARAFGVGALLVAVLFAVVAVSGVLAGDDLRFVASGAGLAIAAGAIVALVQGRLLRRFDAARLPGMQLQIALGVQFVTKLLCLSLGVAALVVANVKFSGIANFGVSFAAASLVLQVCHAALSARSLTRVAADPVRSDSLP